MIPTAQVLVLLSALPSIISAQSIASTAYAPTHGSCPSGFTLVREAGAPGNQTLSSEESAYIAARKSDVLPNAWKSYLANVQATNVSLPSYVSSILGGNTTTANVPTLGIASSGGGYRAAIFGAGVLNALDGRNSSSVAVGTGGLLQAASYLSGLSGGSWLVGSLAQADFPTIQNLLLGPPSTSTSSDAWGGWLAQYTQMAPYNNASQDTTYLQTLIEEVTGKYDAGFAVSYNDIASRDFARHFVNGTTASNLFDTNVAHGAGLTLSGIADLSTFSSHSQPFPIIVSTLISPNGNMSTLAAPGTFPGTFIVPQTNPIFEFNVYEMGSYDPTLAAFAPTQYLGTSDSTTSCVTGYDQTSFIMGASSDWDTLYNTSTEAIMNSAIGPIIAALNESIPQSNIMLDAALFPNPFYGATNGTFIDSNEKIIGFSDGASSGEAVPIQPLLVKARGIDVIFAIDSNQDTADYWSAGGSLVNTQNRTTTFFSSSYSFPPVPTNTSEFIAQNLSTRPTFFGCNSSVDTPLLIYLANGGPPHDGAAPVTNITGTPPQIEPAMTQAILDQTFIIATQGLSATANVTTDPEWAACLACAVVDRARNRTGVDRSGVCGTCFNRYCWDGSTVGLAVTTSGSSRVNLGVQTTALAFVMMIMMTVLGYF